jgi:hypothetical protein
MDRRERGPVGDPQWDKHDDPLEPTWLRWAIFAGTILYALLALLWLT